MNIAILGGTGFIGECFLQLYGAHYNTIKLLTRKKLENLPENFIQIIGQLNDQNAINLLTENVDVLIHAAFDHDYKDNLIGLRHIVNAIKLNNVKRIIYLSSFIVYNFQSSQILNEKCTDSDLFDIYTREKKNIESKLNELTNICQIIVLQPTIVLGNGGNWAKYLLHANTYESLYLANFGENLAPIVYKNDVAKAIHLSIKLPLNNKLNTYEKFIISNGEKITWKEVYQMYANENKSKIFCSSKYFFAESSLNNLVYKFLFSQVGYTLFGKLIKTIKSRLNLNSAAFNKKSSKAFMLAALPRIIQSYNILIDLNKSNLLLKFYPDFNNHKIKVHLLDSLKN